MTRDARFSVRRMTPRDVPSAMRLKDAAGWNQSTNDWLHLLSSRSDGCFVAESEGAVVGTSASIEYGKRLAWIGMLIVEERARGQGIGTALLQCVMRNLDARGLLCLKLDATPLGRPVYEKYGFVTELAIERWMLTRTPNNCDGGPGASLSEDVLALDRLAFGADRSHLLRSIAATSPEFVGIVRDGANVVGYMLGRRGSRADHAGPWVARSPTVAQTLLDAFLRRSARESVFVDVLPHIEWMIPLLQSRGFVHSRPLTRMFRGVNTYPGRPDMICAITGPEFG